MLFITALTLLLASPFAARAAGNEKGIAFLEANQDKEGVIVLPSGLQYKARRNSAKIWRGDPRLNFSFLQVLRKGDGTHHPTPDSSCECHYE